MNVYEQLISEWLSIRGYIVINNVKVGRNASGRSEHNASKGGWAGELDVVGWDPVTGDLVNYEPSIDANAWPKRAERYKRKFSVAKKHVRDIPTASRRARGGFRHLLRCVAVLSHSPKGMPERMQWLDGELITHDALMDDIEQWLRENHGHTKRRYPRNPSAATHATTGVAGILSSTTSRRCSQRECCH